jgi:hypothetical protein
MGIDIRSSNRTRFIRCTYYSNKTTKQEILERSANKLGIFYAQELNGVTNSKQDIGGFIRRDLDVATIVTDDEVELKTDYWVEYYGNLFIVTNVSGTNNEKTNMNSARPQVRTTIQLRK